MNFASDIFFFLKMDILDDLVAMEKLFGVQPFHEKRNSHEHPIESFHFFLYQDFASVTSIHPVCFF